MEGNLMKEITEQVRQCRKRELKLEYENRKPLFLLTKEEVSNWWSGISQNFTRRNIEELRREYCND
jgi:hypothetical protein